jgi:hypothetical protein
MPVVTSSTLKTHRRRLAGKSSKQPIERVRTATEGDPSE